MWKLLGWAVGGVAIVGVGLVAINLVTAPLRVANMAMNSATGVIGQTLDPNNVIQKYEWFHDAHAVYRARIPQIQTTKRAMAEETNAAEKARLRIELNAQQQNCRNIVTQYNSNATKTNQSIFMGREAPPSLEIRACE
jgi:hypothetical protein